MESVNTDDWQLNKSVLESNRHVFENQLYCDIKFIFSAKVKYVVAITNGETCFSKYLHNISVSCAY